MVRQQQRMALNTVILMILSVMVIPSAVFADAASDLQTNTIIQGGGSQDGGANDPIVRQSVGDVNSIQDNSTANNGRGRREKIEDDAIPKGKAGVGAAMAAGIALTAAGTPMLASPIAAVRARGAALLAKAGLEFAQAAATAGVNQQNQKAADALKPADDASGKAGPTPEQVKQEAAEKINSPELQKALGQAGVNSDDFVNKMVNGELRDPAAVLAASGSDSSNITPEMLAAAAQGGPETNGKEELPHVAFNDNIAKPGDGQGGGSGAGLRVGANGKAEGEGQLSTTSTNGGSLLAQAQAMAARSIDLAKASGTDRILKLDANELTAKYLQMLMERQNGGKPVPNMAQRLYDLGIRQLRPKQKIFDVARKSYRDYGKWRGKRAPRLAKVAVP